VGIIAGIVTKSVVVIQAGKTVPDTLELSADTVYFDYAGGIKTVNVKSNRIWSLSNSISWLQVTPAVSSGNGVITLTAANNPAGQRSTVVMITAVPGSIVRKIVVIQEASPVGIDEEEVLRNVLVYPNPSQGEFTISNEGNETVRASLFNTNGQLMGYWEVQPSSIVQVDRKNLENGIYILQLNAEDRSAFIKIAVLK
jgi:hypothetical protein